ncbi:putative phage-associated protein [Luteibacter sp. HA06]|jgi:uncharacterized phage-associated protein
MAPANDIAKYILSLTDEESGELISHLKLQKLLYYCQGFALALTGKPMFSERIEAWQHGPVVPDVWQEYRSCGAAAIPRPEGFDPNVIDDVLRDVANEVYTVYGQYSAWRLRDMTHDEAPWKDAKLNSTIGPDVLCDFFKDRVD